MLSIELDDELASAIEKLAAQEHKPVKQLVHDALIGLLEDYHDVQAAEAAIVRIESGESQLLDWQEVKQGLYDLDG
jgi:predicted DNA-binding protein